MDCEQVKREELVERYLSGELSEAEQDVFEQHYFDCVRCFEELRVLRSLQAGLERAEAAVRTEPERAAWPWRWALAGGLAGVIVLVGMRFWPQGPFGRGKHSPQVAASPRVPPQPTPGVQPVESVPSPGPTLAALARVEPPDYTPALWRGTSDQATVRFRQAMEFYQKKQYGEAIPGLREAAQLNPQAADVRFFLGACYLLNGLPKLAIKEFQRAVALGESPYLEDAHFYLAKAYFLKGNVAAAEKELETTVRLQGEREKQARDLLRKLKTIRGKQP